LIAAVGCEIFRARTLTAAKPVIAAILRGCGQSREQCCRNHTPDSQLMHCRNLEERRPIATVVEHKRTKLNGCAITHSCPVQLPKRSPPNEGLQSEQNGNIICCHG